jgi:hypothetical protein
MGQKIESKYDMVRVREEDVAFANHEPCPRISYFPAIVDPRSGESSQGSGFRCLQPIAIQESFKK